MDFSPGPILGRTPIEGKIRLLGQEDRAPQAWRKADICVGMEEMSSEVQRTRWAWRLGIPAKLKRSMQQNITFQEGQMPRKANVMQL